MLLWPGELKKVDMEQKEELEAKKARGKEEKEKKRLRKNRKIATGRELMCC